MLREIGFALSVAAFALTSSTAAIAQSEKQIEARYSHEYNQCMGSGDAADGVTSAMLDCIGAETERQDARLNQAYKMVIGRLNAQRTATLRASERSWITARDGRCQKESASEEGGTLANVIYADCILSETIKRIMWLENYKV